MFVLYHMVNPLTMWLTFATFVGYAVIYTVILKPRTPQNIVIGGLSGAMPPALGRRGGFRAGRGLGAGADHLHLDAAAFLGAGAYRNHDYAKAGLPMLPVTHGQQFTRLHILLYSVALLATTLLPYIILMSGVLYLTAALVLGGMFLSYAWRLYREYSDELARSMFRFSILYLALLFGALLVDHWVGLLR